ncbi:glutamate-5-semialdehyde dehydrogenase [Candidatus Woesearchaeota archaeon]|nr:glutamate-5-semialdehyde dehydrogenase [Candidatus Woesearchaeota archaeon]
MDKIKIQAELAKKASHFLASAPKDLKNAALKKIAEALMKNSKEILAKNRMDVSNAVKSNMKEALIKRLKIDDAKIKEMIKIVESVIALEDPIGKTLESRMLDKNLELYKVSTPIGVVCAIFESRPDALVQISALCIKSGNAAILKGGSEAINTNRVLAGIIRKAIASASKSLNNAVQLVETREEISRLLEMEDEIDLIVPRGSNAFVKYIQDSTRIPVLGHSEGICHVYIDKYADEKKALQICVDSKVQYPAACNSMETLLVQKDIAGSILPKLKGILENEGVELRGCERTRKIIKANKATENDWKTEYTDLILSIKIVDDVEEAIAHINRYGSRHTDSIVTENETNALKFINEVDSGSVFHNCSTRFSDGYRYGLGAEVGISTNKTHARGPVGLEGLTIYKYILKGKGHVVSAYIGSNARPFMHEKTGKKWKH